LEETEHQMGKAGIDVDIRTMQETYFQMSPDSAIEDFE